MFRKIYSNISITLIKQLREVSGSPINDCKKALESSEGNFEKAMLYLKERGLAQAEKRQGNAAKQGVIVAYTDSKVAALAEINCETDFVARTNEFLDFSQHLIKYLVSQKKELGTTNIDEVLRQGVNQQYFETNIDDKRKQLIGKLQENIMIGNLNVFVAKDNGINYNNEGVFGAYQHNCLKDTICGLAGSVVELIADQPLNDVGAQVLREGANNLAASFLGLKPKFIYEGEVTAEAIQLVKQEVLKEFSNKSAKQQEFILQGKLKGFYADNVFEHMEYVLDENECTIKEYIKNELESVTKSQVKVGRCQYLAI